MSWLRRIALGLVRLHGEEPRKSWFLAFGEQLPPAMLADAVRRLLAEQAARLPPDDALRLILSLDNTFYTLAGRHAIRLDGESHAKHRLTGYHAFFASRLRPGETVLDAGCGQGELSFAMADQAQARVTGLDIDPAKIAAARQRHPHPLVDYLEGDLKGWLPPGGPWETVVLSNVLEHLTERPRVLANLRRQLQPRRFLLRVPLFERDWRVPLKQELGLEWRLDPTHETEYTRESFMEELTQAGLRLSHEECRWGEIWGEAQGVE